MSAPQAHSPLDEPRPADDPKGVAAFEEFYRAQVGFVWGLLRRLGVRDDVLEDVVQDVFVIVHRRRADLRPDASPRSWLFGIARRVAADSRRARGRAERKLREVPAPPVLAGLDDAIARTEAQRFVSEFLDGLEERKRVVYYLAEVQGMTAPEISDALGVNVSTVYTRLQSARDAFERALRRRQARRGE